MSKKISNFFLNYFIENQLKCIIEKQRLIGEEIMSDFTPTV